MMAWGYPVSDCCRTASWTTLFSWGARGTALVLVKVNGFLTSVYGLIQTSMGPTFVWNAFRLSTRPRLSVRPQSFLTRGYSPTLAHQQRCEMRLLFPSSSKRWRLFALLLRIGRVGYGCLDAARFCNQPSDKINRGSVFYRVWLYRADTRGIYLVSVITWRWSPPELFPPDGAKKLKSNYPVHDPLEIHPPR